MTGSKDYNSNLLKLKSNSKLVEVFALSIEVRNRLICTKKLSVHLLILYWVDSMAPFLHMVRLVLAKHSPWKVVLFIQTKNCNSNTNKNKLHAYSTFVCNNLIRFRFCSNSIDIEFWKQAYILILFLRRSAKTGTQRLDTEFIWSHFYSYCPEQSSAILSSCILFRNLPGKLLVSILFITFRTQQTNVAV